MCETIGDIQTTVHHGDIAIDFTGACCALLVYVCACNIHTRYIPIHHSICMCRIVHIYIHSYTYTSIHTYIRLYDLHVYTVKTAGGVGTSGLEMSQNSQGLSWTRDEVDKELESIMKLIHRFLFFIWRLAYICV